MKLPIVTDERMPPNTIAVISGGGGCCVDLAAGIRRYWRFIDGLRFVVRVYPGRRDA